MLGARGPEGLAKCGVAAACWGLVSGAQGVMKPSQWLKGDSKKEQALGEKSFG